MRRIAAPSLALLAVLALAVTGCGGNRPPNDQPLSFEELTDTTGLSKGVDLVRDFEPYRLGGGALRIRGRVNLPDDTRLQVSILRPPGDRVVLRCQVVVQDGRFDSSPLVSSAGPLPVADYRFEVLAHFNDAWQPPHVLRDTDQGRTLRGPGMTRGIHGEAVFRLVEAKRI